MAWHILTVFWLKLICDFLYLLFHVTLLLTFSQLPNEYIISFIHKNTNKTQKISHFLIEINTNKTQKISHFLGEIAISIVTSRSRSWHRDRNRDLADLDCDIAIARCADCDCDWRRSARFQWSRSRSTPIVLSLSRWVCFVRVGFFFLWLSLSFARATEIIWR